MASVPLMPSCGVVRFDGHHSYSHGRSVCRRLLSQLGSPVLVVSDNGGMAQARVLYEDGRPYTVPDSLEELTGPTSGVVELPQRLDWSEQGRYDLSDPRQRNLMYEVVIRESMRVEDLRAFLHGPTLARVWRRLWLLRKVRALWESRFPTLPRVA
jgi:hypothetical protein